MAKLHNVKYCRTCREYLPIPEQKLHMKFHAQPEYFKQKILIKNGQPIKINRKQRASLTPIGKLSHWRTGGQIVKVDSDLKSSTNSPVLLKQQISSSCNGEIKDESTKKLSNKKNSRNITNDGEITNNASSPCLKTNSKLRSTTKTTPKSNLQISRKSGEFSSSKSHKKKPPAKIQKQCELCQEW